MKLKVPTREQAEVIKAHGLCPCMYIVMEEQPAGLTVLHILSGDIKSLER